MSSDFDIYVDRYSKTYHVTPEEAKKHILVQGVKEYYEEREGGKKNENTEIYC